MDAARIGDPAEAPRGHAGDAIADAVALAQFALLRFEQTDESAAGAGGGAGDHGHFRLERLHPPGAHNQKTCRSGLTCCGVEWAQFDARLNSGLERELEAGPACFSAASFARRLRSLRSRRGRVYFARFIERSALNGSTRCDVGRRTPLSFITRPMGSSIWSCNCIICTTTSAPGVTKGPKP